MAGRRGPTNRDYYYCSKCATYVQQNQRVQRVGTKGWVCPRCGLGLYRKPAHIINEVPDLVEVLSAPLAERADTRGLADWEIELLGLPARAVQPAGTIYWTPVP